MMLSSPSTSRCVQEPSVCRVDASSCAVGQILDMNGMSVGTLTNSNHLVTMSDMTRTLALCLVIHYVIILYLSF